MRARKRSFSATIALILATLGCSGTAPTVARNGAPPLALRRTEQVRLPTGMLLTPTAARGAHFEGLNPDLPSNPSFLADHAVDARLSPDGNTLLILTTGYNQNRGRDGKVIARESNEYVFIYDVSAAEPRKQQVVMVANTFNGIAWHPKGEAFYVAGGVDDNVHVFAASGGQFREIATVALGHAAGEGIKTPPMAAGLAVNDAGTLLLVANFENDSVSLVDLEKNSKVAELDLRPGKIDHRQAGKPGGTYPLAVEFVNAQTAYVSSQRDREIIELRIAGENLGVGRRLALRGQPNKMTRNRAGDRLFVAVDNSDHVAVVDAQGARLLAEIPTVAPAAMHSATLGLKGANPNNLVLSTDERTLFVTNGGTNSLSVIALNGTGSGGEVVGLIPTGWYPGGVAASKNGDRLFIVNGKSMAGPNPRACRTKGATYRQCAAANQNIWQLEKAGFLTLPLPTPSELAALTWQVASNNHFATRKSLEQSSMMLAGLRERIKHVIYVIKENRTYDQIHGDLDRGNGDPSLALLSPYSPNHQRLARQFVTLDNFFDSGEASNTGWSWSTAARTTDFTEKTAPVRNAQRGLTYDWEGLNRGINVSAEALKERQRTTRGLPLDPDLLPGQADVAAPDGPEGEVGEGYLWDAALRAGLSIRNYGFFVSNLGSSVRTAESVLAEPFTHQRPQAVANKGALASHTDTYYRGYDLNYADYYRFKEWEREFDGFVAQGHLPQLSLVRFPHDHFGDFATARWNVNTVETQMADNDVALGLLVEKVAHSPFKHNTLIFVVEDDAQNGADHVDAHRSVAYVVGPYIKQGAVISEHYTTVSLLRTIEEVLGIRPMGLNDGLATPMVELFDLAQQQWTYEAVIPDILYSTRLALPEKSGFVSGKTELGACDRQARSPGYWARAMMGQDFSTEDQLNEERFNRALWFGLKGEDVPLPTVRSGADMRSDRDALLQRYREQQGECRPAVDGPPPS